MTTPSIAGLLVTLTGLACACTSSGGGSSAACDAYADQAGIEKVTIRVHNETGQIINLDVGGCKGTQGFPFHLAPATGDVGLVYGSNNGCFQSCGAFEERPYEYCDCTDWAQVLGPGQSTDFVWDGTAIRFGVAMPTSCAVGGGGYFPPCGQLLAAASGSYQVTVDAYPAGTYNGQVPSAGRWQGGPAGTPVPSAPVTFTFPGTPVVDVVFGPGTFPDAGGP